MSTSVEEPASPDAGSERGRSEAVYADLRGVRDAINVRRVYGDPIVVDGVTVIPVARVGGGGGGGGGEGTVEGRPSVGHGTGFGLGAIPVGVYEVTDGSVTWKPAIDATRLARGGQVLAGIIAVCVTLVVILRGRH